MAPWVNSARIVDVVRRLAVFSPLPERAGIELVEKGELLEFDEGQIVIKQGETSDSALVLMDGVADVLAETKYGFVHLASLEAPALVGEIGVFTNVPRTASIRAKTQVRAIKIGRGDLQRFGQANPAFLSALMLQLGRRFETFNKAIGFYTHALSALERDDFDLALLDDLKHPLPELVDFSRSFLHLAEQITLRRAQREEMANARAIQQGMLPEQDVLQGCKAYVDVCALMRPAKEVGGDLYDFFLIDPDRLAITIGDVCGKGIPAALFMAMTQTVMRYTLRREIDVGAAATAGNALLAASNREMMFATLFCCVLDLSSGSLSYCSCGHGSPLILRNGNRIEKTSSIHRPLGIDDKSKYKTNTLVLEPGERLFLCTDGFGDAMNKEELRFGDERLQQGVEKVRALPSEQFIHDLVKEVDDFVGEAPQFDDLTALLATVISRKSV